MKKIGVALLSLLLSATSIAGSVAPQGEFASIDVKSQNMTVEKLSEGKDSYIKKVLKKPDEYNPVVLCALSDALFKKGQKDDAMFWFYAGQLRARSDANKSLDESAAQGVGVINRVFGPQINQYAFTDIAKLEKTVDKVILWDKETLRNYDARWIALHGMDAFTKKKIAFEPKEKWSAIDNKTREDYLNGFKQAMKQMKSGK